MYTTTFTVTEDDNRTRRVAEFTDRCYGKPDYRQTGKLNVIRE